MKKLPAGISTFSEIIEDNYIYVDKTEYIYEMINTGKTYFLSRPRRFGKSLLVSTLKELFQGNKKLFKNLYIQDKWNWNEKYPVIHLDFGSRTSKNPEQLELSLNKFLNDTARDNGLELEDINLLTDNFEELIKKLHKKKGKKVVVLVDEYDKPIIDCISNIEIANKNRDILSDFYQVLKASDEHLKFIFLTGVCKFSRTSIFSKLNNLDDITLDGSYAGLCGYTQNELETCFSKHIDQISLNNNISVEKFLFVIKKWYNGYSWDGSLFLYNPFSILSFFKKKELNNYWFDTGTPTFLIDILKRNTADIEVLLKSNNISGPLPDFDIENLDLKTTLLQTGYLTIIEKKAKFGKLPLYTLDIPNKEVKDSLFSYILGSYTNQTAGDVYPLAENMLNYILKLDELNLRKSLETLLANIPYNLHQRIEDKNEAYYHILFLSWMKLMGFYIQGEIQTSKGRIDAVLKQKDQVVVIEIKYSENKPVDKMLSEAMKQIEGKEYYNPYQDKNIRLLAIAFREKEIDCKIKKI